MNNNQKILKQEEENMKTIPWVQRNAHLLDFTKTQAEWEAEEEAVLSDTSVEEEDEEVNTCSHCGRDMTEEDTRYEDGCAVCFICHVGESDDGMRKRESVPLGYISQNCGLI